jgi:hypothetical protein
MKKILFVLLLARFGYSASLSDSPIRFTQWNAIDLTTLSKGGGATITLLNEVSRSSALVKFPVHNKPFITIPLNGLNLNNSVGIAVPVTNTGTTELVIHANLDNKTNVGGIAIIAPGETDTIGVLFRRSSTTKPAYMDTYLKGIMGLPGGYNSFWEMVDPTNLQSLTLYGFRTTVATEFKLGTVYGWGNFSFPSEALLTSSFFPWVDQYGQFAHESWSGKTTSDQSLSNANSAELLDLGSHAPPGDWDEFRGWKNGPSFTTKGHFYTVKYQGKWWFVTPTGKLFWAFGAYVGASNPTLTQGRTNWYQTLPATGTAEAAFYGTSNGAKTFDFSRWNLLRKYGTDWLNIFKQRVYDRYKSWGLNSFGGWSDASFNTPTLKTPYFQVSYIYPNTVSVSDTAAFRAKMKGQLLKMSPLNADPWLVGVFVGNELHWELIGSDSLPRIAHTFYKILSEEFRIALPNKLFLCDRMNVNIATVKDTASAYCDVVSFNRYGFSGVGNLLTPNSKDKPVIIGEFHFGSVEAGGIGCGLIGAASQKHKGESMEAYVREMLLEPSVIGVSWFIFRDQPITGRPSDGENFNMGFVDVADRPYPYMVNASRRIGRSLFAYRSDSIWDSGPLVHTISSSSSMKSSSSQGPTGISTKPLPAQNPLHSHFYDLNGKRVLGNK